VRHLNQIQNYTPCRHFVWQGVDMRRLVILASILLISACSSEADAPATTPAPVVETAPPATTTTLAPAPETTIPATTTTVDPATEILLRSYSWQEESDAVRELQTLIGRTPDGVYGPLTRESHLEALRAAGLSEDSVPSPDDPSDGSDQAEEAADDEAAPDTTAAPTTTYSAACTVEFLPNMSRVQAPTFHINLLADANGNQPPVYTDDFWPMDIEYVIFNINMASTGGTNGVISDGEQWTSDDAFANGKVVTASLPYQATSGEEVEYSISVSLPSGNACDALGTLTAP
jgi:hypothetical protein